MSIWDKTWTDAKHARAREAAAGVQPKEEGIHVARTAAEVLLDMACDEIERLKSLSGKWT